MKTPRIEAPIRVLHVVGGMDRGGVETWLMHILRGLDPAEVSFDFLVHTDRPCAYDDELRSLGATLLRCPEPHRPLRYMRRLRALLERHGRYDIVHSHVHFFSGLVVAVARWADVPTRVAHSHSDSRWSETRRTSPARRLYRRAMRAWIARHANVHLACSEPAAEALYGPAWHRRSRVLAYGFALEPFQETRDGAALRASLHIPSGSRVIGHVGRFGVPKNHEFLLDVAAPILRADPRARLLLVGDGPLRASIRARAATMRIESQVVFAGLRSDVPALLVHAMDAFLFPSRFEGYPMACLEAQAAGLPCVVSTAVPPSAHIDAAPLWRLPLSAPVDAWRHAVLQALDRGRAPIHAALERATLHGLASEQSVARLMAIYAGARS